MIEPVGVAPDRRVHAARARTGGWLRTVRLYFGRSFFPIVTLVLILGVLVWGPWVSLIVATVMWFVIMQTA